LPAHNPKPLHEHRRFTYQELHGCATQVAQALLAQRGREPEPIGVLLEQGPATVAALLGVLQAGKIFCTLDPTLPPARLRFMLADTGACLVVTEQRHAALANMLPWEFPRLLMDTLPRRAASTGPPLTLAPHDLAYISYSSGSTGQPKGIVHNYRNVLHHVMNYTAVWPIGCTGKDHRTGLDPNALPPIRRHSDRSGGVSSPAPRDPGK
jgi:non-ribosomal peptide synthetase component F